MSNVIRTEVEVTETPEQKTEKEFQVVSNRIDLDGLCKKLHLQWFAYKEPYPGQDEKKPEQRESRQAFFIHEVHNETGLKFYSKREMAEKVCSFSIYCLVPNHPLSLVTWGVRQGCRVSTTATPDRIKEAQAQRAHLEALERAVEKGELENLKQVILDKKVGSEV